MKEKQTYPERDHENLQSRFSNPLLDWYRVHHRKLPWRETKDPYSIFVSELMLQQTQVKTVIPYYQRWLIKYPNVRILAAASESDVLKSWEGLGYYRRVRFLHKAAKVIVRQHGGKFPRDVDSIEALPGVGRYTLGAVTSIAFNLPMPVVDGNVIRVLSRWFGYREVVSQNQNQFWDLAIKLLPKNHQGDFNQAMMELGALVCLPRKPSCLLCPVRKGCFAFEKNLQEHLPNLAPRAVTVRQFEYAGLVVQDRKVLLCRRNKGQRMENLWQFPSVICTKPVRKQSEPWTKAFGAIESSQKLGSINYSVTHHRIRLEFLKIQGFRRRKIKDAQWVKLSEAKALAFTAAHRKLADWFLV
jgi:A/G-specific adenine glycosylase